MRSLRNSVEVEMCFFVNAIKDCSNFGALITNFSKSKDFYGMTTPTLAPTVRLYNGYEMPVLGLGTYKSTGGEVEQAVKHAIDVGYRHIDTAYYYQNECEVGRAVAAKIAAGVVKREQLFLVTKLWNIHHEPARVEGACRQQLAALGVDYVDLYLLHFPVGYKYVDGQTLLPKDAEGLLQLNDVDYLDTYKAMEPLVHLGLVRSLGVSNFNCAQLQRVLNNCHFKPVTNQVECSPALLQCKMLSFCKRHCLVLTAYSPLSRPQPGESTPEFLYAAETQAVARKYGKSAAQIVLRYLLQLGAVPIPKSVNAQRIEENLRVFDFKLTPEDMAVMATYNTGARLVTYEAVKEQKHKYYPFDVE